MEEWCSHCCMTIETRLEPCSCPPVSFVSCCTLCGKLLSDIIIDDPLSLPILQPNSRNSKRMRYKTCYRRRLMKRVEEPKFNDDVKSDLSDSESVCADPTIKEKEEPINSDTIQASDDQ
ncbi:hypothetical protein RIF29_17710 [Crotalaria pallida]|uniref:Uncharacterized protein n=1 Tax=Crotalaria pallida TaxID=3830 RepID=A0AAN9FHM0_CROPI